MGEKTLRVNSRAGRTDYRCAKVAEMGEQSYRRAKYIMNHRDELAPGVYEQLNGGTVSVHAVYIALRAKHTGKPPTPTAAQRVKCLRELREFLADWVPSMPVSVRDCIALIDGVLANNAFLIGEALVRIEKRAGL
jgi:hypothetical protein